MENEFQTGSAAADKSFEFAVRIVNLCKYLRYKKKEFVLSSSSCGAVPASVPMSMREDVRKAERISWRK